MKLNYKRTAIVGLAFMSICSFWGAYDSVVPLILKHIFNINDAIAGGIMALDNVLALFMLPIFGAMSDRTNTRIGRRMPYILIGTGLSCIFAVLMPIAAYMRSLVMFMVFLGLTLLSMSIYRSPAVALMPDVTPKPLRSKGNAVINLMGALGGIFTLGLVAVLTPSDTASPNYIPLFLCIAFIMAACVLVLYIFFREPEAVRQAESEVPEGIAEKDQDKNGKPGARLAPDKRRSLIFLLASIFLWFFGYNAIISAFSKYAQIYWGLKGGLFAYPIIVSQVAAVASFIPAGIIASKYGRRRTVLIGVALLTVSFILLILFKHFSPLILVFFALAGIAWAMINVNSYPMVVEMSRGSDVGRYTGLYYTFSMMSQVITPIVSGALLQYVGYWTLFPYGAFFTALSFITMIFVRHGDSKPEITKSKLEIFE